jgi:hypothetical protein
MRNLLIAGCIALASVLAVGSAWARLPPPTEEQKAKVEEAKAKAAEAAKKEAELLSKVQDRVAERYIKEQKAKGVTVTAVPAKKEEKK